MNPSTPSPVPLLDLKAQYQGLHAEVMAAFEEILLNQQFVNGPAVGRLEQAVAAYCHADHAVGMSSGTDALLCALMALEVGPGDEVITTPFTFFATAGSIARTGAKPVFVDICPDTFNIDPKAIEAAVSPQTKAIMPVHLFGQIADMDQILGLAKKHGLHVVEDAAQAIGAQSFGRPAGSIGTVGCFSFFPSKNLGGAGDGGMVTTSDGTLAEKMKSFRNHGDAGQPRYHHRWVGGNFRLDTLQAAYLEIKLKHLDAWSQRRRENAKRYGQLLGDVSSIVLPTIAEGNVSIFNQFVIRAERRDALQAHLAEQGIGSAVYYPLGLHEQACFADLGYRPGQFPMTEAACREVLALPIYPELSDPQIEQVAQAVRGFYQA